MEFIDLHRQYDCIKEQVQARIAKVIAKKHFIMGPEVEELEKKLAEFTGRKYAFTCASGTDALAIPLMAYELKREDAVFVSSFTFFASAETVSLTGGTPVFVDSDQTYNLDPQALRRQIEKTLADGKLKPRGIIAVDIFGLPADHDAVHKIAEEYGLFVLEDAAQGFGGYYNGRPNGSFGDVSATSFFPAKPLGCYGDGGAIFTDDDALAEKIHSIRVHGQGSSRYDNVRIGVNGRMDTIQAAVVLCKLEIFKDELAKRQVVAKQYLQQLKDTTLTLPVIPENCVSAYAQLTFMAPDKETRDRIVSELKAENIPIMVYYAVPMHMQTAFAELGYQPEDLPVCADMSNRVFSVPMHPYLKSEEIEEICQHIKACL
jgi:UDP-2-acetamido-2-deoxy-ribo-hexuluronate aminotransferase